MKYLHIMPYGNNIHNKNVIELINTEKNFNPSEHLFVIKDKKLYEDVSQYNNCIHSPNALSTIEVKKCIRKSQRVLFHGMALKNSQLYCLSKNDLKRIVWIVWGHDLYVVDDKVNLQSKLKTYLKRIWWVIRKQPLKKINSVGIGFKYDALRINELFGSKTRILNMPYFQGEEPLLFDNKGKKTTDSSTRIMVGHSAFSFLNHIEILNKLQRYKNENIKIILILSYGSRDYANRVKTAAFEMFEKEKVEVIEQAIAYMDYVKLIRDIDIAILDYKHQSALGNFYLLTYFGKKIFLNKNGVLKQCARIEGWALDNIDSIGEISYQEFVSKIDGTTEEKMRQFGEYYYNRRIALSNWECSLKEMMQI